MKIQTRLLSGYAGMSVLIVALGALILSTIDRASPIVDELDRQVEDLGRVISLSGLSGNIVSLRADLSRTTNQFIHAPDPAHEHEYDRASRHIVEVFDEAIKKSETEDDATIFRNLREASQKLEIREREIIALAKANRLEEARALSESDSYMELNAAISKFIAIFANRKQADSRDEFSRLIDISTTIRANRENLDTLAIVTWVSVLLILLSSILVGMLMARMIARPLRVMKEGVVRIGEGSLDHRIGMKRNDEIGVLSNAFDDMAERLKVSRDAVEASNKKLEDHQQELVTTVQERTADLKAANEYLEREIQDRKRGEEQLILAKQLADAANASKSEFLANMSHEIRTPMTAILGFAENMLDADQSDSEKLNCVHIIRRNGEYLIGIINDILDLSKIEAGKMAIERGDCHPCRIIADVVALVRVRADAKGLPFNIEYIGAIPETIQSDPTRLRQILINLIGNAIKFTEVGAVRLVTRFVDRCDVPCLQFDVIDTGRGMTQEQAAKLFRPFMQADTSTTREFGGTGLGLTISKRFAELLGGDITVVETEIGVGSTFRATVATGSLDGVKMLEDPLSVTVVADPAGTTAQVAPSNLLGVRILLAEDGPDNQRLISFVLKKAGADVTVEENGKLALDAALAARDEDNPFDCILMDMQMPVMDGYEATGQLRQKGYSGPIIALTAHAMASDREKCIKAGCDDYATKPIDRQKLVELILEYVQDRPLKPDSDPTETPERPPLWGCRILLAEDNPSNQVLVVGILKKAGAEMTAVKDGKLALDAALAARDHSRPFDIILMDIQMPLMGGDEATKLLRNKGYTETIIALTAHATEGDRQKYLEVGFDDYATKPINRTTLIETMRQHWVGSKAVPTTVT